MISMIIISTRLLLLVFYYTRFMRWVKYFCSLELVLEIFTAWKVSKYGIIRGPYFPVFSPNTRKYGPEITPIWSFFTQWFFLTLLKLYELNVKKLIFLDWLFTISRFSDKSTLPVSPLSVSNSSFFNVVISHFDSFACLILFLNASVSS